MRVSMQNMYSSNLYSLQKATIEIARLNEMQSTGKSLLKPSDNPIGSVQVIGTQRDVAATTQYIDNIKSLSSGLDRSETHLSSMIDLQGRLREIAVASNNGSLSPEDRAAYGAEMEELMESMVSLVNATDESGNYLFSGNLTDTQPLLKDTNGVYIYQGDSNQREVQVANNTWMEANVTADAFIFSNGTDDIFNQAQAYIDILNDPTLSPGDVNFDNASTAMQDTLDDTLNSISATITDLGGKQNSLSLTQSSHEEMNIFSEALIGEIETLDYAQATAEFNMKLTALQVTQQTFVQISKLSLFSQI
ncbi:flagellar hook-associated protein FlgL [Shewanella surugensis]|uniref:Flagellar hook-associated protein FlgL n=1 Tax=Shewanella surugensis TaxID=212020 RepID=A0ABT0LB31_9GAMM|nr:flagellar hook-associated protein FlgL [Shewanella surugensis]MCL1124779.1 flagellar hook-associated protein FlgL [Shewanella surugensis]